ncbi:type I methionyl aminopeptidase [bacterium]|nr:type I methionyl aminopeptidase [bacterium]MBU1985474.1 type I methionyl aminopeptidase [bacterium]
MIVVKTEREIEIMRHAGAILAGAFEVAASLMKPGMVAREIDRAVEEFIRRSGGIPSFKNYPNAQGVPFPASVCLSIEAEVVHGIPGDQVLEAGTILGLDIGVRYEGYHADAARTYAIGEVDDERRRLMAVTERALELAIAQAYDGNRLSNIGYTVQTYAESQGCSVVRDLVGHGIGRKLHEDPQIPNYGDPDQGPILRRNMTLAIEPMINLGTWEVDMIGDWQVLTRDRRPSAHFEHTVVVRDGEPEILTFS